MRRRRKGQHLVQRLTSRSCSMNCDPVQCTVRGSRRQAGGKGECWTMLSLGGHPSIVSGFLGGENVILFEAHFAVSVAGCIPPGCW